MNTTHLRCGPSACVALAWRSLLPSLAALFVSLLAAGALAEQAESTDVALPPLGTALAPGARAVLAGIATEVHPPPAQHYFRSNEWRQDLLRPHLEGLGGAYVGVGSDQNYTMAAMAGSELLFLVDYDPRIPWIHDIYRVLIRASENPQALVARFADDQVESTRTILTEGLAEHPRQAQLLRHFRRVREAWKHYLRRVAQLSRNEASFSWLSDPALYAHVKRLFDEGRVVTRQGDLTQEGSFRAVAKACERLSVPVNVIYFSNAEQFFPYTEPFIENMRALPVTPKTLVLRTIRHRNIQIADQGRWHYMLHHHDDFLTQLDTGRYRRSFGFVADLLRAGPPHLGGEGDQRPQSRRPMMS